MYSPTLGRFLQRDPLPQQGASELLYTHDYAAKAVARRNIYEYVDGQPLNEVDPSGLAGADIQFINYIVAKHGLSPEGRAALHVALQELKVAGGLAPKAAVEAEAQFIKSLSGKFIKGGGAALGVVGAWLVLENTAHAAEISWNWRDGLRYGNWERHQCECARFLQVVIVPSWWVWDDVEWLESTIASNWIDFGCLTVADCKTLEDENRVIGETSMSGYTLYNTSYVRCRFDGKR